MKVSDYIIRYLSDIGVSCFFGFPGGMVTHLMDSIHKNAKTRFICMHHEQGAAFAAEGYSRVKNSLGVAFATSGPGATNLITGIGSAYFDSIPVLFITGQVNTYESRGDLRIRQRGFQELDIVSVVKPITKYAVQITDPLRIRYEFEKAAYIACNGRPGPVLLDIPMDVQRADIAPHTLDPYYPITEKNDISPIDGEIIDKIVDLLFRAKRPVFLLGGGLRYCESSALKRIIETLQVPVATSLLGMDCCSSKYSLNAGLIGAYGNRYGNYTLAGSDLILALGSRLDNRQTGPRHTFARHATIVRVDIDSYELEFSIKENEIAIKADCSDFLQAIYGRIPKKALNIQPWRKRILEWKTAYPSVDPSLEKLPNVLVQKLSSLANDNAVVLTDVGQNQIWAAQSFEIKEGQRMLTSAGMGSMGFSLAASIGAYYADPTRQIISLNGDGGIQMNIQELQTIVRNKLPIKMVVLNNNCLGMIRHFQEMYFDSVYTGTIDGYDAPDFSKVANSYGINSMTVDAESIDKISDVFKDDLPWLVDIVLPRHTYVYPKLSMGRPIEDQDPLLNRSEYARNVEYF